MIRTACQAATAMMLCLGMMGCSNETSSSSTSSDPGSIAGRVVAPESNAKPDDYTAETATFRVIGVETGDGPQHARAIISEVGSWQTHEYRVGDEFGRGLRVTRLAKDRVELSGTSGSMDLMVGADTKVERLLHRYDLASKNLGKNRWQIDSKTLVDVRDQHGVGGTGAMVRLLDQDALKISAIAPGSLLDRLGFRVGDLVLAVDGAPVSASSIDDLVSRVTTPSSETHVSTYRHGSLLDLTFAP